VENAVTDTAGRRCVGSIDLHLCWFNHAQHRQDFSRVNQAAGVPMKREIAIGRIFILATCNYIASVAKFSSDREV